MLAAVGPFRVPRAALIFAIVAAAPFSVTDALAASNGMLFGPWKGSLVNALGLALAAIIGYAIARRTSKLLAIELSQAQPVVRATFSPSTTFRCGFTSTARTS